jgi:hypothetical protein
MQPVYAVFFRDGKPHLGGFDTLVAAKNAARAAESERGQFDIIESDLSTGPGAAPTRVVFESTRLPMKDCVHEWALGHSSMETEFYESTQPEPVVRAMHMDTRDCTNCGAEEWRQMDSCSGEWFQRP